MPKVSVCIPIFNVEQYVARCIESIQSQSLEDIEIIVVNDCTPDNSMEIVRKYADKDCRIKIVEHDVNHGLMVARRTGYMAALGDYVTFCDSDDAMAEGALENLYSVAIMENADIVSGVIQYIPNKGSRYLWPNKMIYGMDKVSVYKSLLNNECGHNLCSRMFKRELLQNYIYQTFEGATNGEDGILFYQVVDNASKIVAIDSIVYEYYQNVCSSSCSQLNERALRSILIANSIRIKTAGKYPELKKDVTKKISQVLLSLKDRGYDIDNLVREFSLGWYAKPLTFVLSNGFFAYVLMRVKSVYRMICK